MLGLFSIFATGVGLFVLIRNQFNNKKTDGSKCLPLELTLKITQEIKYQMIIVCIEFARQVANQLKKALNPAQMDQIMTKLKANLFKFYSQK